MTIQPLEPGRAEMEGMARDAIALLADFIEDRSKAPAVDLDDAGRMVPELLRPPSEEPGELAALLDVFHRAAEQAVDTAGPGYLAYIPGGGLFTAALAEMLARGVNRFTGLSGLAPALVAMEEGVLRWLCGQFGLPEAGAGLVTTGGSIATLSAVVAARHDRLGEDFADGTLYVTAHTHHCVAKAARIAGFPAARVRTVPATPEFRMDVAAAARLIAEDRAAGLRPFLLVGTAGTTNTGTVDPLGELAELARREGLWFHVDAAYGGFFQLTARGRAAFAGIEAADSLVLDPHKGMFLPYGTGVLLVRDRATLRGAHSGEAAYLQDLGELAGLPDYADLGPELTREFRGLRLWLPLHLHGVAVFREALDEKLDLAERAYRELASDPLLEVPLKPDLSAVVFRLPGGDRDNQRLLERINATKRVFLSSTRIDGRHTLRLCVLSHRTHADHVAEAVDIIRAAARGALSA
ncbi:MAG: aminotransferase class V-fold PLP-dependent enzyme [Streptosporangiales bacterium]|nr:aminotransferase class V-fold PLP-dependent enzyme [Streptosporangiales bacterium]